MQFLSDNMTLYTKFVESHLRLFHQHFKTENRSDNVVQIGSIDQSIYSLCWLLDWTNLFHIVVAFVICFKVFIGSAR